MIRNFRIHVILAAIGVFSSIPNAIASYNTQQEIIRNRPTVQIEYAKSLCQALDNNYTVQEWVSNLIDKSIDANLDSNEVSINIVGAFGYQPSVCPKHTVKVMSNLDKLVNTDGSGSD